MGKEIQNVLDYVQENVEERKAEPVLNAIESYRKRTVLKTLLEKEQGDILGAEVKKIDRLVGLELGTHCGYFAIKIASTMVKPGYLISLDTDISTLQIAQELMNRAGIPSTLDVSESGISKVTLLKGTLKEEAVKLQKLLDTIPAPGFNFIFMNHDANSYNDDLKYLKEKRMLKKGTVIVANTTGLPPKHKYFKYLKEHTEKLEIPVRGSAVEVMGMEVSIWI